MVFINQGSVWASGRHRRAEGAGWNTSRDRARASFNLASFGWKRVSQADAILCGRGAGWHQRTRQIIAAQRLGLSVLSGQELDLDLGVLLTSPPLPGRCIQSGPLQAGGGGVLVIRGVNIPEPTLARLLFSAGNF